ncbi:MAG: aspartate kinase [Chloroflexi bacterium]|nr:aspartate kinase [Chloroflexota bacterium]
MSIIVQKYGGSSVANADRIRNVAGRVAARRAAGNEMVVVVSAMGDTTDDLIALAHQISDQPSPRELDVLLSTGEIVASTLTAMALRHVNVDAISLSGLQAGIQTDSIHSKARIRHIDPKRIHRELESGHVVIVAGFQGVTEEMDVTTLGRGASDITAVALAVALGAERCETYKDVEGIYTADPRIVPEARKLRDIGYEEMLELASHGAQVLAPRSVELAQIYELPILVASSFNEEPGTLVHAEATMEQTNKVRGIAHDTDVAKITIRGVPDRPGIAATLFEPLAANQISVDTIVQNASLQNLTDMTFTVTRGSLRRAIEIAEPVAKEIGAAGFVADERLGKVSIVGTGMQNSPGYASRMFRALFDAGINIQLITTSEIRITCLIEQDRVPDAVRALHAAFELEKA